MLVGKAFLTSAFHRHIVLYYFAFASAFGPAGPASHCPCLCCCLRRSSPPAVPSTPPPWLPAAAVPSPGPALLPLSTLACSCVSHCCFLFEAAATSFFLVALRLIRSSIISKFAVNSETAREAWSCNFRQHLQTVQGI